LALDVPTGYDQRFYRNRLWPAPANLMFQYFCRFVRERKVFWIIDEDVVDSNMMALLNLHSASTAETIEDFIEIIKSGL